MNMIIIILFVIGIIAIIVSVFMTTEDKEETVNPNVPTKLSDADKKHLNKLVDDHVKEYSKKKVKEKVDATLQESIQEQAGKIDERATEDTQKLEQYYNEVMASIFYPPPNSNFNLSTTPGLALQAS